MNPKNMFTLTALLAASLVGAQAAETVSTNAPPPPPGLVRAEFIAENPPFPSSHASTLVETRNGLIAAWFGGSRERALDVSIYLARHDGQKWSAPEEVANGVNEAQRLRHPCWNPVLFQQRGGSLLLFYKVGPSPDSWWGLVKSSDDGGHTWSKARRLPPNFYGPIVGPVRNKPVELADGTLLCPASSEDAGWRVHMEKTKNPFGEWTRTPALNRAMEYGAIQPTILQHKSGEIQILCRTKQHKIVGASSKDNGKSWTRLMATGLPNPNSAIDAVMLHDGRALLVYNHAETGRAQMNVAVSADGKNWQAALVLENEPGSEFSYPAVIQTSDALVHVTYTWKRQRIKHVVLDPSKFTARDILDGQWPLK